jgi:hypothetical protein
VLRYPLGWASGLLTCVCLDQSAGPASSAASCADHEIGLLTVPSISIQPSSPSSSALSPPPQHQPQRGSAGSAATAHAMNPPLLLPAKTFPLAAPSTRNETSHSSSSSTESPSPARERAWSESHVHSASTSSLFLTDSGTYTDEPSDPLSVLWKQPPKQSSSLFRRLSRGHRKSNSSPGDLKRSLSDRSAPVNREDEEDVVLVPQHLQRGIEMLRVTRKKVTKRICSIDPVNACVSWDSKDSSKRSSSISRNKTNK